MRLDLRGSGLVCDLVREKLQRTAGYRLVDRWAAFRLTIEEAEVSTLTIDGVDSVVEAAAVAQLDEQSRLHPGLGLGRIVLAREGGNRDPHALVLQIPANHARREGDPYPEALATAIHRAILVASRHGKRRSVWGWLTGREAGRGR
jgi:hypothetical protein